MSGFKPDWPMRISIVSIKQRAQNKWELFPLYVHLFSTIFDLIINPYSCTFLFNVGVWLFLYGLIWTFFVSIPSSICKFYWCMYDNLRFLLEIFPSIHYLIITKVTMYNLIHSFFLLYLVFIIQKKIRLQVVTGSSI